jgi:hypothetical protein
MFYVLRAGRTYCKISGRGRDRADKKYFSDSLPGSSRTVRVDRRCHDEEEGVSLHDEGSTDRYGTGTAPGPYLLVSTVPGTRYRRNQMVPVPGTVDYVVG